MNVKRLLTKGKTPALAFAKWRKIPSDKTYLARRKKLVCCENKQPDRDRARYGTSRCDSYGLAYRLAVIIANNLFQYLADAKPRIVRDDWDILEKHAQAIVEFYEADSWDELSKEPQKRRAYKQKQKAFVAAMSYLVKNWEGLWW